MINNKEQCIWLDKQKKVQCTLFCINNSKIIKPNLTLLMNSL